MTERDALLRAICDSPGEDTPRLVYADWLDEHGEHEQAEFIRVSCGVAPNPLPRGVTDPQLWCRERMRHLEELNRAAWSKWKCPECDGKQHVCLACTSMRDLFKIPGEAFEWLPIHFRRGFPAIVEVPDMGWVCQVDDDPRSSEARDPSLAAHYPTPWLRAVARHTTIEEVWVMDRVPEEFDRRNGTIVWSWFLDGLQSDLAALPEPIFDCLDGWDEISDGRKMWYRKDAARSALGRAWIEWGREWFKEED